MMKDRHRIRKATDLVARGLCVAFTLLAVVALANVLIHVAKEGMASLSWSFFTELPKPVGEAGGGLANTILGTLILVALACLVGIPVGVLGGVYLAEFGNNRFGAVVRFCVEVMSGVPAIVVGIFVSALVVAAMGFSALAGGIALGIIMIPTVTRTSEELIRLVPDNLREAALALGVPKWRTIFRVVMRTAAPGIATGIMLAVARVAGESAPLLLTSLNNRFWSTDLSQPIGSMPVQIFTYAGSPYEDWHQKAWGAALVLVGMVLILNIAGRMVVFFRGGAR